jgi:glycosyltransferase involved in cell wall biosynthesis
VTKINDMQCSVVMITLNEEGAIAKVVNDIRQFCPHVEIVVVDSSKDRTAEIASELGCKVVKQFPPKGYGPAMHQALTSAGRDFVITMDCDDTYPVEAINILINKIDEGYDLVSASRLGKRPENMPLANFCANWLFALAARLICGVETTDVHTGMRIYRKSLLENFPYQPRGLALPVELQVGPASLGYKCTEVFIDYRPRIGESKLDRFASTVWTFKRIWRWRRFFNQERIELTKHLSPSR